MMGGGKASSSAPGLITAQLGAGSKVSLISKSEIRYEGILSSFNLLEATISMEKVRSFGTEGRPAIHQVPPKDEVLEFIIFRGLDIKKIEVLGSSLTPPGKRASGEGVLKWGPSC